MPIETTINIDKKYLEKLAALCDTYSLKRNFLLTLLLTRFFKHQTLSCIMFKTVSYQKRRPKKAWKIIHVSFVADLFEKCCDARKCCKFSVSLLIAKAIDLYLDSIEKELAENGKNQTNISDNYYQNYICIYNSNQEMTNYHIYWNKRGAKREKNT